MASELGDGEAPSAAAGKRERIASVDRLRGLVMLPMLVDHTREFFHFGHPVADPIKLDATSPGLAATRIASHLCAPVFVALTGLAAWLYGDGRPRRAASAFLLKRGVFLVALELTAVDFAWTFALPPTVLLLQVIWAIGLAMIALAGLVWLPRATVIALGVTIVAGHDLVDGVHAAPGLRARISYPVLPWIGGIALGWGIGPWFATATPPAVRRRRLAMLGAGLIALFAALRLANGYGDPVPWSSRPGALEQALAFLDLTKYPSSLDFVLATSGVGALLLAALEGGRGRMLAVLGGHAAVLPHRASLRPASAARSGGRVGRSDVRGAVGTVAVGDRGHAGAAAVAMHAPVRRL